MFGCIFMIFGHSGHFRTALFFIFSAIGAFVHVAKAYVRFFAYCPSPEGYFGRIVRAMYWSWDHLVIGRYGWEALKISSTLGRKRVHTSCLLTTNSTKRKRKHVLVHSLQCYGSEPLKILCLAFLNLRFLFTKVQPSTRFERRCKTRQYKILYAFSGRLTFLVSWQ